MIFTRVHRRTRVARTLYTAVYVCANRRGIRMMMTFFYLVFFYEFFFFLLLSRPLLSFCRYPWAGISRTEKLATLNSIPP